MKRKKKVKYRKVKWWKKCKELIISLSLMGMMRGQKKKEGRKGERCPEARPALGKFGKCGTELAKRERGSRRTTEKDGGGDEDATGSKGKRKQMGGGDSTKVEAAKRRRQN